MRNELILIVIGTVFACMALVQTGCYYDNEDDLYPFQNVCDTTVTTLATVVKPILMGNCYSCHSASSAGGLGAGINLEDYNNLKGYADGGSLVCAVEHGSGCSAMPKSASKLRDCDILKIKTWVARGAQNN